LIELLVVVLIIGILTAIALPKYNVAVLDAKYTALFPQMKAFADSIKRYKLEAQADPTSIDQLDITRSSAADVASTVSAYGSFEISAYIGGTGSLVWLAVRQANNYDITCETYANYAPGIKLCLKHGGVKRTCEPSIWQGGGAIYCYTLPMQGGGTQ